MKFQVFLRPAVYACLWFISTVWVFFLGFMLGQSKTPETILPFMQTMLPQQDSSHNTPFVPIAENELTYSTILQKANEPIVIPNEANVVEKDKKVIASTKNTAGQITKNTTPDVEQVYKFSLQLLAVKQKKGAEEYMQKLKEQGIATEIVETSNNTITWYRVYTTFEGTVTEFNTLKDRLASVGIVDTILRERISQ